jgi:hypothetical protein
VISMAVLRPLVQFATKRSAGRKELPDDGIGTSFVTPWPASCNNVASVSCTAMWRPTKLLRRQHRRWSPNVSSNVHRHLAARAFWLPSWIRWRVYFHS